MGNLAGRATRCQAISASLDAPNAKNLDLVISQSASHIALIAGSAIIGVGGREPSRSRVQHRGVLHVDLNELLHRNEVSLILDEEATNLEERRAHEQFALDYAARGRTTGRQLRKDDG